MGSQAIEIAAFKVDLKIRGRLRRYKAWGLERRKLRKPLKQEKEISLFSKNKKPV